MISHPRGRLPLRVFFSLEESLLFHCCVCACVHTAGYNCFLLTTVDR